MSISWYQNPEWWAVIIAFVALAGAIWIGWGQNKINKAIHKIQDTVELYASCLLIVKNEKDIVVSSTPYIHVQNVGTRLIYLNKYIFNGRIYETHGQILPSTYSQALNNFYRIELPTNDETHVSLEVFYHDLDSRKWSSRIYANKDKDVWNVETLPREQITI